MTNPLPDVVEFPSRIRGNAGETLCKALRACIESIKNDSGCCHIPRLHPLYESHKGMSYHFKPEIFIQISGTTEFTFPGQQITVQPGSVCIVPKGLPHSEVARGEGGSFENILVSFYNETVYAHITHGQSPGVPTIDSVDFFTTNLFSDLVLYLDRLGELHHADPVRNAVAIRALLLAEFALLLSVIEAPGRQQPPATDIIALCKWQIHQWLHDEQLSLESLAAKLGCSPSYLSRLFHQKVGERIVEHINRLRIHNAIEALRHTRLSVKVIAVGCGYRDAGYFGRVFRQVTGRSPQQYRRHVHHAAPALELQPRTVHAELKEHEAMPNLGEMNALDALRLTKLSIKAIAAGCGYRDAKLFTRFFQQATGTSPQKYRRDTQHPTSAQELQVRPIAATFNGFASVKRQSTSV